MTGQHLQDYGTSFCVSTPPSSNRASHRGRPSGIHPPKLITPWNTTMAATSFMTAGGVLITVLVPTSPTTTAAVMKRLPAHACTAASICSLTMQTGCTTTQDTEQP